VLRWLAQSAGELQRPLTSSLAGRKSKVYMPRYTCLVWLLVRTHAWSGILAVHSRSERTLGFEFKSEVLEYQYTAHTSGSCCCGVIYSRQAQMQNIPRSACAQTHAARKESSGDHVDCCHPEERSPQNVFCINRCTRRGKPQRFLRSEERKLSGTLLVYDTYAIRRP